MSSGSSFSSQNNDNENATTPVYVISVAAELAGVHPQTLRIYERKGLLGPSRTAGGNRRYSFSDIARLKRIQDLTRIGINLEGVRKILELEEKLSKIQSELEYVRNSAATDIMNVHRHYKRDLVPLKSKKLPIRWGSDSTELQFLIEIWNRYH
jgi:MerR family transcriptional regulator/heat shock protein HspR